MWEALFFFFFPSVHDDKYDTPTLEKVTRERSIAHFFVAVSVVSLCFLLLAVEAA
jgi:hypothetical protein